jgi:hypothetical protein
MRCCTLFLTVLYANMIVSSFSTMSVVSAFGRETRDAMAAESVSRMTLSEGLIRFIRREKDGLSEGTVDVPFVYCLVEGEQDEIEVLQQRPLLDLVPEEHRHGVTECAQRGLYTDN